MPQNTSVNDDFDDDDDEPQDPSQAMKQMRKQLRQLEKDNKELADIRRENAMLKAGIDTSTKLGQLFARSFDGDLSDIEALKSEATEVGLLKPAEAATTTTTDATAPAADAPAPDTSTTDRRNLSSGALPDDGAGTDPRREAFNRAEAAIKEGKSFEKSAGSFIAEIAQAAMNGDRRVLVQD